MICEHCNTKENLSKCQTKRMGRKKLVLIKEWYDNDIQKSLDACNEQCKILNVFDTDFKIALTSVNFQLGTKWFRKFPAAWKALCHREYDKAIDEIMYANKEEERYSRWYKQTPVRVKDFVAAIENVKESA